MKKLLLILLCLPLLTLAQQTYVPDDNFEAYLEMNDEYGNLSQWPNTMGDGILNNDSVLTANINTVTALYMSGGNIYDLTGVEDFTSLTLLDCSGNWLTTLDVASNTNLTHLECHSNNLITLDLTDNIALAFLRCGFNDITSLNVSNNTLLTTLYCYSNYLLTSLDVRNGNNFNFNLFFALGNPNLSCISVDDSVYSTNNWTTDIDPQHYFSNNCSGITDIEEYTTNKELLKVTDLLGRETKQTNQPLFYIYDDGTVEKRIVIE